MGRTFYGRGDAQTTLNVFMAPHKRSNTIVSAGGRGEGILSLSWTYVNKTESSCVLHCGIPIFIKVLPATWTYQ